MPQTATLTLFYRDRNKPNDEVETGGWGVEGGAVLFQADDRVTAIPLDLLEKAEAVPSEPTEEELEQLEQFRRMLEEAEAAEGDDGDEPIVIDFPEKK